MLLDPVKFWQQFKKPLMRVDNRVIIILDNRSTIGDCVFPVSAGVTIM